MLREAQFPHISEGQFRLVNIAHVGCDSGRFSQRKAP
jgi:hypothetical protein